MSLNRLSGKLKNPGTTSDDSPVFDSAVEAILQFKSIKDKLGNESAQG